MSNKSKLIENFDNNAHLGISVVSKRFYIGCEVSLKSNKYSNGIIINTAKKRQGSTYWEVEWYDGEITKVREDTLNVC